MISGGEEGLSLYSKPPPSLPFHSSLYLLPQSAVTHNEARLGDGANQEAKTATAAQTTVIEAQRTTVEMVHILA